jgi:hypothetical protein
MRDGSKQNLYKLVNLIPVQKNTTAPAHSDDVQAGGQQQGSGFTG